MALAPVKKIAIYGLQSERKRLLKTVQASGLLELTNLNPEVSEKSANLAKVSVELKADAAAVDRRNAAIVRSLAFLDQIDPVKPNMIQQFAGVKTYLSPREFAAIAQDEARCQNAVTQLGRLEQELTRIQAKRLQLQTLADNLMPWRTLDLPYAGLQGTAAIKVILGSMSHSLAELEAGLAEITAPVYLEQVSVVNNTVLFSLFIGNEAREAVQAVLTRFNVTQVVLPAYESTVAARIDQLQRQLATLNEEEARTREAVLALAPERMVLQVFYDSLNDERNRLEASTQLLYADRSFGLSGWIIADQYALLEQQLSQAKLQYVLADAAPLEGERPPTALRNNKLVTPFEYLVQSFSYPQTSEIDPTPSIAPFFFLFFGIALGDAGYGLMLAVICGILLMKLKMGPVGRKLSWMFLFSGIGAILVGLMTGSVLALQNLKFGVFNPLENPILLLLIALGLGLVQLFYGLLLSALSTVREGKWGQALANQGTLIFFLVSVILFLAKDAIGLKQYGSQLVLLLELATAGMVLGNMYGKKGLVAKLVAIPGAFYNIYNTIGFFSDVLSYSRLMALGLSGGVMGSIMNQLAGMVFNSLPVIGWLFGALIFLFGHVLNFALCILGAYVHSSRLQYLEFFGKFFEGGGRPFTPFSNKPKYTFLVNEREA